MPRHDCSLLRERVERRGPVLSSSAFRRVRAVLTRRPYVSAFGGGVYERDSRTAATLALTVGVRRDQG